MSSVMTTVTHEKLDTFSLLKSTFSREETNTAVLLVFDPECRAGLQQMASNVWKLTRRQKTQLYKRNIRCFVFH